jgi:2-C-methyl-D-erythritol 4-phosphate cytidylyltransferase
MPAFALILPAAGKSTRFGQSRSKLLEPLAGATVIARALRPFLNFGELANVIIPTGDPDTIRAALDQPLDPRITFCPGGVTRARSVLEAIRRVPESVEWVAVHDAARPLITPQLIQTTLETAQRHGAAVPALPVALTIKQANGPLPAKVNKTIPRDTLWSMQTPQIMRRSDLLRAFDQCPLPLDQVTDDVQLLELIGKEVWLVPGDERNLKITTAIDLRIAELWLANGTS